MKIPGHVLVDTNVVNFILDHADAIFDGGCIANYQPPDMQEDIESLRDIFWTGRRAQWQIAVSPITYTEIMATAQAGRRAALDNWFGELWGLLIWRPLCPSNPISIRMRPISCFDFPANSSIAPCM